MYKGSVPLEKELLNKIFEISEEARSDYTEETIKDLSLFEDLKYDSVSLVDLLISLEEKYDVELTEDMSDFFVKARIKNISLPKSVNKIETGAFNYIKSARFKISKENIKYGTSNNCIYSKKSGRLVVAASIKDIISIPDQVTCLKEGTSFPGKSIKKIIFPVSLKKIGKYWNSSLLCEKNVELVFKGKKPPEIDATAYLPFSKVYVPKNKKSGYEKAFKRFVDNGDILIHAY